MCWLANTPFLSFLIFPEFLLDEAHSTGNKGFGDKAKMFWKMFWKMLLFWKSSIARLALLPHSSPQWQEEALGGCAGSDSFGQTLPNCIDTS